MTDTGSETLLGGGAGDYAAIPTHHGGVAIAEVLKAAGVERVFGLPGGHIAALFNGCQDVGIEVLTTRHESAAVHMAEAWARTTGKVGVAAITAGPGFTNAVTGLTNAERTGIPVVVFGGRTPLNLRGKGAVQDADQHAVAAAVCKWAREATSPAQLAPLTVEALGVAQSGRRGSAYLDLPTDVILGEAPKIDVHLATVPATGADEASIRAAVELLAAAERPVIVAGGGAFWSGAGDALAALGEASGIPVTTTSHARGLLADSSELCLGNLLHGGVAVAAADVVLLAGSRFNGNLTFGGPPLWRDDHRIIAIDVDPAAFALNRAPDVALLGDAAAVLEQLANAWTGAPHADWRDQAASFAQMSWDHWVSETEGEAVGVHPGWLAEQVCAFAAEQGPSATLVIDGGDILGWGLAFTRCEEPGSLLFTSDALGTLGVGVPYCVAAPFGRPDGPTIGLIGDGAFGLSAMEIETAVRAGTAPVIVVSNNRSWGDVRYEEGEWFGRTVGTDISAARYDLLCEALGGHGEHVEEPDQLRPALERALASGVVSVVNVVTDPDKPNEILRNMDALALQ